MYNNNRRSPEYPYSVTLSVGLAAREFTFQSPNFTTRISHFDISADAADGTDFPSWNVVIASTTVMSAIVVQAADTVVRTTSFVAGTSDLVPPNTRIKLGLTIAATVGNVLGLAARLVLIGTN